LSGRGVFDGAAVVVSIREYIRHESFSQPLEFCKESAIDSPDYRAYFPAYTSKLPHKPAAYMADLMSTSSWACTRKSCAMEIDGLKALSVFVDSLVFIGKNYRYEHPSFVALKDAVSAGRANLLITDITIEEVKAHIDNDVGESSQALKKVRGATKILRNIATLSDSAIFNDIDRVSVGKELYNQFEQFLADASAVIISVSEADPRCVFDCYFKRSAPFGEGKKKSEFPDAFALSALNEWAESEQENVFVVSQDSDMSGIEVDFPRLVALIDAGIDQDSQIPVCAAYSVSGS
jgi:hypothetical protein